MMILSLVERDVAAMRRAILSAPEKADALEVRLDAVPRADPRLLFGGAPRPIIATCRRKADGGLYTGSETKRHEILWEAARAGASYIDIESDVAAGALSSLPGSAPGIGVIVSHHDTRGMPRDPDALYRRMSRVKAAKAVKIVGTAKRPSDAIKVRDLLGRHGRSGPPLISFCMGAPGVISRVMALEWGSWAIYASSGSGQPAASGQLSLPDLIGVYRIGDIDDETRFAGIIGHPLAHTLSPVMHNAAYQADGVNFRYVPLEIPRPEDLRGLGALARGLRIRGLSVTAPWKIKVMKHLDVVEPTAARIGAVNTIVCDGQRLIGFNTDASGGLSALRGALASQRLSPGGLTIAIVGAGGAARAMAHACAMDGASIVVASRAAAPGRTLAAAVGGRFVPLNRLSREEYDVLINCTPVGTSRPGSPVTDAAIKGRLVYDVVYSPESTTLLEKAGARGIATLGGLEMLVRQAAEQYTLFTGRAAPVDVMREAARQSLGRSPRSG
ncbi:MAG TPA: shikimate dehydrogenase [Patescibacteria group bacterium]|nr:shikimate dehydrogenase [Patescibacteria group bacterium]